MTLKVGDRVRLHYPHPRFETGMVVRLAGSNTVEVLPDGGYRFPPHCAVTRGAGSYPSSEVTKIEEPTPKFKVGDRVRISTEHYAQGYVGMEAEVLGLLNHDVRLKPLSDRPRGLGRATFYWPADQVEKVETVPFKLERGDKVVNRKTGRTGFVTGGLVYDYNNIASKPVPTKAIEEYEEHYPGSYDLIKKDVPW